MTFGVWHNGTTDLPLKETDEGIVIPDASLAEMNRDRQRIAVDRIEHGVLADEHGFDRLTFTEHHFVISGFEHSPNPLMSQMAVAARTDRIKLRQMANIVSWHDPLQLAEQTALLDIVSDGRVEVGIGRGYMPREAETFGQYWGGTVQDQEKNRASFEEKVEILHTAWTEDLFSHSGEFHSIPPSYTKWHHPQDEAYLSDEVTEYDVEDAIEWRGDSIADTDVDADDPNLVIEGDSTLTGLSVLPKPLQEPHPQVWEPVGSDRSIEFAAERGINPYLAGSRPPSLITQTIEQYYEATEEAGWPDRRPEFDGEPFEKPWDDARQRGFTIYVPVFNTNVGSEDTFERWKLGIKAFWQYIGFFGQAGGLAAISDSDDHPLEILRNLSTELLVEKDLYFAGDADAIIDRLATIMEAIDADVPCFDIIFEMPGVTAEEADRQLEAFGNRVIPYFEEST